MNILSFNLNKQIKYYFKILFTQYNTIFYRFYQELKPLTDSELENLPVLCSGSALRFLLTRVDNWNSSNEVDIVNYQDPKEFLNRLKFHEQINNIEDYGL